MGLGRVAPGIMRAWVVVWMRNPVRSCEALVPRGVHARCEVGHCNVACAVAARPGGARQSHCRLEGVGRAFDPSEAPWSQETENRQFMCLVRCWPLLFLSCPFPFPVPVALIFLPPSVSSSSSWATQTLAASLCSCRTDFCFRVGRRGEHFFKWLSSPERVSALSLSLKERCVRQKKNKSACKERSRAKAH